MALDWGVISNLESSLEDFLVSEALNDSVDVSVHVGRVFDEKWTLPTIRVYVDSKQKPRLEIGSNKRQNAYLMIVDIHARNNFERINLGDWVETVINDGFTYYEYSYDVGDPDNPTRTSKGYASFDYIASQPVDFGVDVNKYDLWRYRISINAWIIER